MKTKLLLIFLLSSFWINTINAQTYTITLLSKNTQRPLAGVHISTVDTSNQLMKLKLIAVTDTLGVAQISLNLDQGEHGLLLISHVSFLSKTISLSTLDSSKTHIIKLADKVRELPSIEVVFSESHIEEELVFIPNTTITINKTPKAVRAFRIQRNEVTVRQFKTFVEETNYVTEVEKNKIKVSVLKLAEATDAYQKRFKNIKKEPFKKAKKVRFQGWERKFELSQKSDINWRHDEFGNIRGEDEMDFPVINITWNDAYAYASWAKMRLPTHEEWVVSAKDSKAIGWYRKLSTGVLKDVNSSPSNKRGIKNLYGNVAEFLSDHIVIDGKNYIKATGFHSFASEYTEVTETLLLEESKILSGLIKYGFRCVKND